MVLKDINKNECDEFKIYINNIKKFESFLLDLLDNRESYDEIAQSGKIIRLLNKLLTTFRFFEIEPVCFPVGFLYLEKLKNQGCKISLKNISMWLMISLLESIKMYDDNYIDNIEYSKCMKLDLEMVNLTEAYFLNKLSFKLYVKPEEYYAFIKKFNLT